MKKLLLIFSICTIAVSAAFSQDDLYYTGDESTVEVKSDIAPPALPDYEQPVCPVDGYIWTPGYWAWGLTGYYWVPGVWVAPPRVGLFWTPGYWGFYHGYYGWHSGYWSEHVGYYGGVCYGYGYYGSGFYGGRWEGGYFVYNTAAWRVNHRIVRHVYVNREYGTPVANHYSYNGPGGVKAHPIAAEVTYMHENHIKATEIQVAHNQMASNDKRQYVSENHGRPNTTVVRSANNEHYNNTRANRNTTVHTNTTTTVHTTTTNQPHYNNNTNREVHSSRPNTVPNQNMHTNTVRPQPQHTNTVRQQPQHTNTVPHSASPRPSGGGTRGGAHSSGGGRH